jgi:hypothetical protein
MGMFGKMLILHSEESRTDGNDLMEKRLFGVYPKAFALGSFSLSCFR